MEGYDSAFHTTEDMLCIDYCRQGRMEYPAGPDAYSYVEAGDLKLDRRLEHQGLFINELVPLIDKRFRTTASKTERAVAGFSMG